MSWPQCPQTEMPRDRNGSDRNGSDRNGTDRNGTDRIGQTEKSCSDGENTRKRASKADFCGFHFWFLSSFFTTKQLKQDCSNVKYNGRTKETSSWTFFFYAENFNRLKLSSICNATINPFSHRFTQCEQVYLTITRTGNELEICSNPLKKAENLAVSVKRNLGRFTFVACYGWRQYWGRFRGFMTT